ncbi:MAG: 1-acyl-sn-glycerol-3-phosphate acyltransferase, partial [Myxococcales bacterium]|nr:1-acyl-sn-glycerol-3-phosphate acyltransferase [Myxococcales bacterium]
MVDRPALWFRLLGSLFRPVQFPDEELEKIQTAHRAGRVVFVLRSESLLDYLYFNWAFLRKGLPLATFGQGMPMWPWRALRSGAGRLWRRLFQKTPSDAESVKGALLAGQPVLLFLQRARSVLPFVRRTPVDLVAAVTEAAATLAAARAAGTGDGDGPSSSDSTVSFVPLMIVWERGQNRLKRSILDAVFGDYETPGRARKLLNFIGGHRIAFVRVGHPIGPIAVAVDSVAGHPGVPPERLRYELESAFRAEERVIKGPITKTSAEVRSELMRTDAMQAEIRSLAESTGKPAPEVKTQVETGLAEIAADMRPGWVEFMCYLLNFVFGRIYGGLEVDDLHAVRETAKRMPLIVLPSHKSHLDYLLISYLFYIYGILPPHIAAGANLNFWPVGHVFRHTGAFFIRRSFRQDEIYSRTLKAYLQKLLKDGRSVEFFIEGTRSRTGKLLKPKYGLLGHVIDAVAHGQVFDVALCPTAVGYELIVEGQSYAR